MHMGKEWEHQVQEEFCIVGQALQALLKPASKFYRYAAFLIDPLISPSNEYSQRGGTSSTGGVGSVL
ncbi:hypothetical protein J6590_038288 [Homalodisca vitripennis]|nr:hypothetical protein J6590_038288 [Homalodisca vitripennis]